MIENTDQRSKDYSDIKDKFRQDTLITLTTKNTVCATIEVAAVRLLVKRQCVWRLVQSLRNT